MRSIAVDFQSAITPCSSDMFLYTQDSLHNLSHPWPLHVTPVTCTPAAWLNLLKKMWSEVSPAWFHWSSEVLWKGKLTTVHLQNLLVPACWAAWAGDNLEAAGVSGKLWRQAFLGFFLLLLGLLFSGFCSDQMWSCKRKPTRKQKPKQPWQNKVYGNPHRSWGGWCRTVGMMWTPLWTLCLLELACCSFGSCLKPWGLWGWCFPRVMIAGFIFPWSSGVFWCRESQPGLNEEIWGYPK